VAQYHMLKAGIMVLETLMFLEKKLGLKEEVYELKTVVR
jgi:hypothetical protein